MKLSLACRGVQVGRTQEAGVLLFWLVSHSRCRCTIGVAAAVLAHAHLLQQAQQQPGSCHTVTVVKVMTVLRFLTASWLCQHDTNTFVRFSGSDRLLPAVSLPGFTGDFWRAYHEVIPKAPGFDRRKELYLLYHYLNHTNLFGGETADGVCLVHVHLSAAAWLSAQRPSTVFVVWCGVCKPCHNVCLLVLLTCRWLLQHKPTHDGASG